MKDKRLKEVKEQGMDYSEDVYALQGFKNEEVKIENFEKTS